MNRPMDTRGFTLIELLVVIAIIGILSAVVLASLNTARLKGTDAAIQSEAEQLRTTFELEYSSSGSYANIEAGGGWWPGPTWRGVCSGFNGTTATQAQQICNTLVQDAGTSACNPNCVYFGSVHGGDVQKYSIMAYLPGASAAAGSAQYLCMGSSGATSISPANNGWNSPGCWNNP